MSVEDYDDITPMEIDEPDDTDTAVNDPEDPDEHQDWDRSLHGGMWEYATEQSDEPVCRAGDDAEKGV